MMSRVLLALALAASCRAWDTPPHQLMTRAAVDTLPRRIRARLGEEEAKLVEIYCILPDRYLELKQFGFARNSPGPRTLEEMQPYCVRPDGTAVHSASGDREEDLAAVVFVFERTIRSLSRKRTADAARYMGTLAHFIEDSSSPPHSPGAAALETQAPPEGHAKLNVHRAIERSIPQFDLGSRTPRVLAPHLVPAAETVVLKCYAIAARNRSGMPAMIESARTGDEPALDAHRLWAGRAAAEVLADALYTIFSMADR